MLAKVILPLIPLFVFYSFFLPFFCFVLLFSFLPSSSFASFHIGIGATAERVARPSSPHASEAKESKEMTSALDSALSTPSSCCAEAETKGKMFSELAVSSEVQYCTVCLSVASAFLSRGLTWRACGVTVC